MTRRQPAAWHSAAIYSAAAVFFAATTAVSYARWASFEYRTFDAAYYTQALWQLLHGRFSSSLLSVPLLGNHVEPIILALAPIFALVPQPITLVVLQNAALALMAPLGFGIARSLGIENRAALPVSLALLLTPATAYVALHEFHPEAFAAPLILLLIKAQAAKSLRTYWIASVALLACKENMAAVVAAFCAVEFLRNRRAPRAQLWRWYIAPAVLAIGWLALCITVITPLLNRGNVDYATLYSHPGAAFAQALIHGNLIPALLLPFLALPLLQPRWLVIAAPVLLQHLFSWRSSEWTIYFHYAAPLLPLFWMAAAETIAMPSFRHVATPVAAAVVLSCAIAQTLLGPAADIIRTPYDWVRSTPLRGERQSFVSRIPAAASVIAPLPYLSHLAQREKLYSLHLLLKGLNTLSTSTYTPPAPPDYLLVDYADDATFDSSAGYYHPQMRATDGRVIASSEQLLHELLVRADWRAESQDSITLLQRIDKPAAAPAPVASTPIRVSEGTELLDVTTSGNLVLSFTWRLDEHRTVFPWMYLVLTNETPPGRRWISKGFCGIEAAGGVHQERWVVTKNAAPAGTYNAELLFFDQSKRTWAQAHSTSTAIAPLIPPVPVGRLRIE